MNHSHLASIFISPVHFALAIFLQNGRVKAVDADKPESVCCWQQSRFAERDLSSPETGSAFSHSVLCDEIGFFCVSTCVLQLWQILATCVPLNGTVSVYGESNELKNVSVMNYLANNKKKHLQFIKAMLKLFSLQTARQTKISFNFPIALNKEIKT